MRMNIPSFTTHTHVRATCTWPQRPYMYVCYGYEVRDHRKYAANTCCACACTLARGRGRVRVRCQFYNLNENRSNANRLSHKLDIIQGQYCFDELYGVFCVPNVKSQPDDHNMCGVAANATTKWLISTQFHSFLFDFWIEHFHWSGKCVPLIRATIIQGISESWMEFVSTFGIHKCDVNCHNLPGQKWLCVSPFETNK